MKLAALAVLASFAIVGGVAAGAGQPELPLDRLTVPNSVLPNGCVLRAVEPAVTSLRLVAFREPQFPTNPWSGRDPRFAAYVRTAVDGAPVYQDAPPLDRDQLARQQNAQLDQIDEAYRAEYVTSDSGALAPPSLSVEVLAVRFTDAKWITPDRPPGAVSRQGGDASRIVRGNTVVRVSARPHNRCFQAIDRYVRSLK